MANIYYNGGDITDSSRTEGILTFSEIPNILEIQEDVVGVKGQFEIVVLSEFSQVVSGNGQYYLTLFGETISNVLSPTEATNKRFYVYPQAQGSAATNTTMSMVKAFRSCASLSAEYYITTASTNYSGDTILITAKTIGKRNFMQNFDTNIEDDYVAPSVVHDGSADGSSNNLAYNDGYFNSKIDVEVYQGDNYVTTLEKNWYGDSCVFNMTPVLATMTEPSIEFNGESVLSYSFNINKLAENGAYTSLGQVSGLTTYGYQANASDHYLPLSLIMLSNNLSDDKANKLYTYGYDIPYSVLCRAGNSPSGGFSVTYKAYDSAMNEIYTYIDSYRTPYGDAYIKDIICSIPSSLTNAFYIDIDMGHDKIRYQVIKPLKASDGYQRVMWRNEYGGVSFFDFTGARSITNDIEIETYEKNIFGFYDVDILGRETSELKKIYSNKLSKTWKMKSHIMEKGGQYIFDSMMKSKKIWTVLDGKNVVLIPKSLEVSEDGTYDNLFTATVQFVFSDDINN